MHLHMYHPVLYQIGVSSLTTLSYEGCKEPYLICSITTPGHVAGCRDDFVFPCCSILHCTHCRALSAWLGIRWHLTTIKTATVTIAATPLSINFSTSWPGGELNLDSPTSLTETKTQWRARTQGTYCVYCSQSLISYPPSCDIWRGTVRLIRIHRHKKCHYSANYRQNRNSCVSPLKVWKGQGCV